MEQYKCKRCEWTGRIKKYRRCLSCKRKKDRRRYWGNVEYHRAKARIRMLAYRSKCKRCEWTGRIKKYRRCLSCKRKKDRRRYWGNVEYHRAKARIRMLAY